IDGGRRYLTGPPGTGQPPPAGTAMEAQGFDCRCRKPPGQRGGGRAEGSTLWAQSKRLPRAVAPPSSGYVSAAWIDSLPWLGSRQAARKKANCANGPWAVAPWTTRNWGNDRAVSTGTWTAGPPGAAGQPTAPPQPAVPVAVRAGPAGLDAGPGPGAIRPSPADGGGHPRPQPGQSRGAGLVAGARSDQLHRLRPGGHGAGGHAGHRRGEIGRAHV